MNTFVQYFFFFKKVTKLKELKIGTNVIIWQIKNNIPSLWHAAIYRWQHYGFIFISIASCFKIFSTLRWSPNWIIIPNRRIRSNIGGVIWIQVVILFWCLTSHLNFALMLESVESNSRSEYKIINKTWHLSPLASSKAQENRYIFPTKLWTL